MPKVSIVNNVDANIDEGMHRSIELIGGWNRFVKSGDKVLIKPNLFIKNNYLSGTITHPELILSVCKALRETGADVTIGEKTKNVYENLKDYPEIKKYARIISFEDAPCKNITLKDSNSLKVSLPVPGLIDECDVFINMPAIRTHALTKISNALKNLMGILPDTASFHIHMCGLQQSIVDLNVYRKSDLIISDGIYSLHENFPAAGTPLKSNMIISGDNAVAVDSVAAEIIGFRPKDVAHLNFAHTKGLGPISLEEIDLCGASLKSIRKTVKFNKAPSNFNGIKDECMIYYTRVCDECIAAAASGLTEALKANGKYKKDLEKTAVVIGPFEKLPEINAQEIILYGNCTYPYKTKGHHIPGCPPLATKLLETIKSLHKN